MHNADIIFCISYDFYLYGFKSTGQTFQANNETFLPRLTFDTSHLVFPAVNTKESTYRTILLTNNGTTPIMFDVLKDPTKYGLVLF